MWNSGAGSDIHVMLVQSFRTNHIERFNPTLRQGVSRLVCEALSFSKKLANHSGAIKLFMGHYNRTRAAALGEHYMECTTLAVAP